MQRIMNFSEQDVLCGRGGGTLRHTGNKKYRSLIKQSKPVYLISSKNEKTAISRSIVAAIRKSHGRFLERSKNMETWYDIGDAKATEKTSQALREGQPKLRKKMIDHGIITDEFQSCSTENMISLLPAASASEINPKPSTLKIGPNPVFEVGNSSYSSVDNNARTTINQQRSVPEQSMNRVFNDVKPMTFVERQHTIGNCRFHPTDCPITSECQFEKPTSRIISFDKPRSRLVTPPATPENPPQHTVDTSRFENAMFLCPFSSDDFGTNMVKDFDDENSIMTFEVDDDEMIDDDLEDYLEIIPTSTPTPPVTNHFRALTELKDNVPMYDNDDNQSMFTHTIPMHTSPITNHLRALTELKDQVPIYPSISTNQCDSTRYNRGCQYNGNVSRNNLITSCSSMDFEPNMVFPTQVNF